MNPWVKNTIGVIASIVVLSIAFVIGSVFMLHSSLPEYSGSVKLSNVKNKINIYRDNFGIPYIYAESDEDAYLHKM